MGTVTYPLTAPEPESEVPTEPGPGRFMENISDDVKASLRTIVANFKDDTLSARREEVKKAKQAREYWKGIQNIWWSESDQEWRFPFETLENQNSMNDQMPRYSFTTNIYQAFGLSIIAVLSQTTPHTKLFPQSTRQPEDVSTAKAGSEVIRLIQRNNPASALLEQIAYYAWTDGKVAGYMRYVEDGLRFGYKDQPIMGEGNVQIPGDEAAMACPGCGSATPMSEFEGYCPGCGNELTEDHLVPPPSYPVPMQMGSKRVAKGQEILVYNGFFFLTKNIFSILRIYQKQK